MATGKDRLLCSVRYTNGTTSTSETDSYSEDESRRSIILIFPFEYSHPTTTVTTTTETKKISSVSVSLHGVQILSVYLNGIKPNVLSRDLNFSKDGKANSHCTESRTYLTKASNMRIRVGLLKSEDDIVSMVEVEADMIDMASILHTHGLRIQEPDFPLNSLPVVRKKRSGKRGRPKIEKPVET